MKRLALLLLAVALVAPPAAHAQLTMQMSNGWTFAFAGNVNAFLVYAKESESGLTVFAPGGIVGRGLDSAGATRIRTGLLPAFATFSAKGKEGKTELGVHFGFAPQIQCGTTNSVGEALHDCFGAQIDMRQVYLTIGGSWGTILAGRELGLYGRQNILTDQTLFGIGGTGGQGGQGTTLGRIGFGYIYPQFKAQITWTSRGGRPLQVSVGLFDPAFNGLYDVIETPRIEAEAVWTRKEWKGWVGGLLQSNGTTDPSDESATAVGISGGVRYSTKTFTVTGSGYYGKGLGTTLLFLNGTDGDADLGGDNLRTSNGYIAQVTFTPTNSKATIAGSYGASLLEASDVEKAAGGAPDFKTENGLASGGVYYQATKSLKIVGEINYSWTKETVADLEKNSEFAPAVGFMLFF